MFFDRVLGAQSDSPFLEFTGSWIALCGKSWIPIWVFTPFENPFSQKCGPVVIDKSVIKGEILLKDWWSDSKTVTFPICAFVLSNRGACAQVSYKTLPRDWDEIGGIARG